MSTLNKQLILRNEIEQISLLSDFVNDIAEGAGIEDPSLSLSLNLALEEAVTNVVLYAYPEGVKGDVMIEAMFKDELLTFVISDQGIAFDPTAKEDADITLSAEERPIGGLGIFLVKQLMDCVDYQRVEGRNILTMSKHIQL
jgi:sigma-B regulation protein RsbU (phosphoserine phosphatase)